MIPAATAPFNTDTNCKNFFAGKGQNEHRKMNYYANTQNQFYKLIPIEVWHGFIIQLNLFL